MEVEKILSANGKPLFVVDKFVYEINQKAKEGSTVVYQDVLANNVSELQKDYDMEEIGAAMPTSQSTRTILHRHRASFRPRLPKTLRELTLEDCWARTRDGENFLIINDGRDDRIVGFATDASLAILCDSRDVYMDGTFRVVPKLFLKLYSVHAFYEGKMMPLLYFLLPSKSTETYTRMFNLLKQYVEPRGLRFYPRNFHIDFEDAVLLAIDDIFPASEVKGCLFHFCRAVWRKVQSVGLAQSYRSDVNVKR